MKDLGKSLTDTLPIGDRTQKKMEHGRWNIEDGTKKIEHRR